MSLSAIHRGLALENKQEFKSTPVTLTLDGMSPHLAYGHERLACDVTDNTVATLISNSADLPGIARGIDKITGAKRFLAVLTQPGKEIVAPEGYVLAQAHKSFTRMRHGNREVILETTAKILAEHKELVSELDNHLKLSIDEHDLVAGQSVGEVYKKIHELLVGHAGFTASKIEEYSQEDIFGKMARFKSHGISFAALIKKENNDFIGIVRALDMGGSFCYLSDETINQSVLCLNHFSNNEEQRRRFLFAYLMNRTCCTLPPSKHDFIIIAAAGREALYNMMGFDVLNLKNAAVFIQLGAPTQTFKDIKAKQIDFVKTAFETEMKITAEISPTPPPVSKSYSSR